MRVLEKAGIEGVYRDHGELYNGVYKAYVRSLPGNSPPVIALDIPV